MNHRSVSARADSSPVLLVWFGAPRKRGEFELVMTGPNSSWRRVPGSRGSRALEVSRFTIATPHPAFNKRLLLDPSVYAHRVNNGFGFWTIEVLSARVKPFGSLEGRGPAVGGG